MRPPSPGRGTTNRPRPATVDLGGPDRRSLGYRHRMTKLLATLTTAAFASVVPIRTAPTVTWQPTGSLATARSYHAALRLPDGRVLVAGGVGADGVLDSAELFDPAAGTWSPTGSMHDGRMVFTATLLSDGR